MTEQVILVDEHDRPMGFMDIQQAHFEARLHRSFAIFIFNTSGHLMLQMRSMNKQFSPGTWSNTCSGHPRPGETVTSAAHRRLKEEMGFDCSFSDSFSFTYNERFGNYPPEHEFEHVFIGITNQLPNINTQEVSAYRFMTISEIEEDLKINRSNYTLWFTSTFNRVLDYLDNNANKN